MHESLHPSSDSKRKNQDFNAIPNVFTLPDLLNVLAPGVGQFWPKVVPGTERLVVSVLWGQDKLINSLGEKISNTPLGSAWGQYRTVLYKKQEGNSNIWRENIEKLILNRQWTRWFCPQFAPVMALLPKIAACADWQQYLFDLTIHSGQKSNIRSDIRQHAWILTSPLISPLSWNPVKITPATLNPEGLNHLSQAPSTESTNTDQSYEDSLNLTFLDEIFSKGARSTAIELMSFL